eukprot:TRINITY_DN1089_c0_g1_i4.p1 TRINITY_DN1089_c0_g1~~TRINITY_DN1089_c0_g1_i4.p1  ORF type:complete len:587 (-),score=135.50 TRINITY_DN1089_c0_g1_i4:179-1885(-)
MSQLSVFLLGQDSEVIWGCRTCYEAFASREDLEEHRNIEHQGKVRHGTCYDVSSKAYTCPSCQLVSKKYSLVKFIYHRKQCLVDPTLGITKDHDEEGFQDDATADIIDPWGIINKPLRVTNSRSTWVCEALIGKVVPILFPCHVCYQVFTEEKDIKDHFRSLHLNVENCVENGHHYDRKLDCYLCPTCKKEVCKGQRTSIYFIHHMRKCQGLDHKVTWNCDKCSKPFSNFSAYTYHMKTACETQDFICHFCQMRLKTKKDLRNHVVYVHSNSKPYMCTKCPKAFKRKGDLVMHMQSHNPNMEFNCEHCGKIFNQERKLKRHILCHVSYLEKAHQCPHCTQRFARKQKLVNHISTHFTEKKFPCDICEVKLKTKDGLYSHKKKVHGGSNIKMISNTTAPQPQQQLPQQIMIKASSMLPLAPQQLVTTSTTTANFSTSNMILGGVGGEIIVDSGQQHHQGIAVDLAAVAVDAGQQQEHHLVAVPADDLQQQLIIQSSHHHHNHHQQLNHQEQQQQQVAVLGDPEQQQQQQVAVLEGHLGNHQQQLTLVEELPIVAANIVASTSNIIVKES